MQSEIGNHINGSVLDVETTGVNPLTDEIIELCIVHFRYDITEGKIKEILETYTGLREPSCRIHPGASRVNGLTLNDVKGAVLDHATVSRLLGQSEFLIAHNAPFDRSFLLRLFPQAASIRWYCSMSGISWSSKGFSHRGLQKLLAFHNMVPSSAHRAKADADATLHLLSHIQDNGSTYLSELLASHISISPKQIG